MRAEVEREIAVISDCWRGIAGETQIVPSAWVELEVRGLGVVLLIRSKVEDGESEGRLQDELEGVIVIVGGVLHERDRLLAGVSPPYPEAKSPRGRPPH